MKYDEITKHIDYILSYAMKKCDNSYDAEDLTSETILSAIMYLESGGAIENPKSYLLTILNRKYYSLLRKKYKLPTTAIADGHDIIDNDDFVENIINEQDREAIRREVAYLSKSYREIIVKHYFYGESVIDIGKDFGLCEGTVKSRLDFGRKQIKKGFEDMKSYTENSYMPQKLILRNSGRLGFNDEPMSLCDDENTLAQNLLILAYERPISISDLSKEIGVATAYCEPIIKKLLEGELMKQMGDGKVYTDFIIYNAEDYVKYIKEQEAFAEKYIEAYLEPVKEAINELKKTDFYSLPLERYMLIHIACEGLRLCDRTLPPQIFPDRPNGGKWIAFGTVYPYNYKIPEDKKGKEEYLMSGQRWTRLENYLDKYDLCFYNYETSLYPCTSKFPDGFASIQENESNMLKLFCLIKNKISPSTVDLDERIIKAIPKLKENGFIEEKNGELKLKAACITHEQEKTFWDICEKAARKFAVRIEKPLLDYYKTHRKQIPKHLKSVPEQKLLMPYSPGAMMFVYEAISKGVHPRDLGYPCPESIVVIE